MHETTTLLLITLPNIHRFKKKFTHTLSNKPFLTWLLTTPPYLKQVATLPCNLSLMASFADINVSLGSVAIYARCTEMFYVHSTAHLLRNLPVKSFVNRLKFDRIMVTSQWPRFVAHPMQYNAKQKTEHKNACSLESSYTNLLQKLLIA